jgi:hypothetical protein
MLLAYTQTAQKKTGTGHNKSRYYAYENSFSASFKQITEHLA